MHTIHRIVLTTSLALTVFCAHAQNSEAQRLTGSSTRLSDQPVVSANALAQKQAPLRVAVVGLVHGHVAGFLPQLAHHPEIQLVGIEEADQAIASKYQSKYQLDPKLFYTDLNLMLERTHPQAILVYTDVQDHRKAIEAAAIHGISSMVEKPLTISLEDALAIRKVAQLHHVHVLTNYETTWYASNREVQAELEAGKLGELRKMIVRDGHEGPKEIGVGPEFLNWLVDPNKNGAGALYDFGCYGVDLTTWLMHGETPVSVTAETQTDKPSVYAGTDDDSVIVLRYPHTQAVILGSWNWSFAVKNMEAYGTNGYAFTEGTNQLHVRYKGQKEAALITAAAIPAPHDNSLSYLYAVLTGQLESKGDLSALDTNVIVVQILDAARTSARTGKTIQLQPLPSQ